MKKLIAFVLALVCVFGLVGCSNNYTEETLLDLARKELPVSNADTIDLVQAGITTHEDKALVWFISGNEYQEHYYLPLEVEILDNGQYKHCHTHNTRERYENIAYIPWGSGVAVCVNDPDCATLHLEDTMGREQSVEIEDGDYPFVAYYDTAVTVHFFDKDGNEYK